MSTIRISTALLILLALLTALDAVAIDMYLPAMPAIAGSLQVDAGRIQQTLVVFLAGLAIGQALYGPLLDSYGRRMPLIAGMLLFILGSALAALSDSPEMLTAARFIQALGAAAGLVTPRAIVSDVCTVSESAKIYSILMQVMMVAPILAPLIGGLVLQTASWHAIFWLLALFGVIALLWCLSGLPETLPVERRVRLDGRSVLRSYANMLAHRDFMAYTLAGSFILGSLFTYISASAFIFTHDFSLSPATFSYLFALNSVMLICGGFLSNSLLTRGYSEKTLTVAGIMVHGLAAASLLLLVLSGTASLIAYALLIALAIGSLGLVFGNLTALTMQHAQQQAGIASSIMGSVQYFLSSIIGLIYSKLVFGLESLPLVMLACSIIAVIFVLKVKTKQ
ncbi:multidrug effflux MFS transporter [Klebsiella sp. BIGb0407]|uniref:multidrug effflux MFS transporter n=1 Tax=Klebsiella sp. BIGb0407 TaxID=2940603 RepID=UPI002169160C|nr:multidrug effflux MFS transporter [Klebsiella sp. BIGb0407]MCS3430598.1 DHA1 family bicyclomycin/chloramphenicol resistance-like MFS transporter [Klebsiella sp. BIGb0407]